MTNLIKNNTIIAQLYDAENRGKWISLHSQSQDVRYYSMIVSQDGMASLYQPEEGVYLGGHIEVESLLSKIVFLNDPTGQYSLGQFYEFSMVNDPDEVAYLNTLMFNPVRNHLSSPKAQAVAEENEPELEGLRQKLEQWSITPDPEDVLKNPVEERELSRRLEALSSIPMTSVESEAVVEDNDPISQKLRQRLEAVTSSTTEPRATSNKKIGRVGELWRELARGFEKITGITCISLSCLSSSKPQLAPKKNDPEMEVLYQRLQALQEDSPEAQEMQELAIHLDLLPRYEKESRDFGTPLLEETIDDRRLNNIRGASKSCRKKTQRLIDINI